MIFEKPFIHLLRSPNSGYFFDVNRNEIVQVDEEVFESLYAEQIGEDTDSTAQKKEKKEILKGKGYLSSNKVKDIRHSAISNLHNILEKSMNMICLQVTQNCNLRCEYCIYSETNNKPNINYIF